MCKCKTPCWIVICEPYAVMPFLSSFYRYNLWSPVTVISLERLLQSPLRTEDKLRGFLTSKSKLVFQFHFPLWTGTRTTLSTLSYWILKCLFSITVYAHGVMFHCQSERRPDHCFQIGCGSYVAPLILLHVEILENTSAECRVLPPVLCACKLSSSILPSVFCYATLQSNLTNSSQLSTTHSFISNY